ncbi:MAG: carboxypeptidase-like regulatory domain-containing protein, partial [Bacteroidia bacterium]
MRSKVSILLFLMLCFYKTEAQIPTQTIRGIVVDKISQSPLPGAIIQITKSDPAVATTSDANGKFELKNIPTGKQTLKISFLGYKELLLQDLSVNSGKELVLNINLEEDTKTMKEIVVTDKTEKNKPLNSMSTVSTRTFSVEETQKFAAALNDPARMATSFPGVIQPGDGNDISIRGNSPNGLLW